MKMAQYGINYTMKEMEEVYEPQILHEAGELYSCKGKEATLE